MRQNDFTLEDAYAIQLEDLKLWEAVLNYETFQRLAEKVKEINAKGYNSPYDVLRGEGISQIVANFRNDIRNAEVKAKRNLLEKIGGTRNINPEAK
jgi:hypothetical protein